MSDSAVLVACLCCEIFLNEEIGRLSLEEYLYKDDISYEVTAGNHQLGGTRMGLNASESSHLLYVSDALYSNTCSMYAMEEIMQGLRLRFL